MNRELMIEYLTKQIFFEERSVAMYENMIGLPNAADCIAKGKENIARFNAKLAIYLDGCTCRPQDACVCAYCSEQSALQELPF